MSQSQIETLLYQAMGLDAISIGSAAIERAVTLRMAQIGIKSLDDYYQTLRSSSAELQELVEAVVVPETSFFRHREAFEALNRYVLDEWLPSHTWGTLRVLSIPCSTGEEPYTIVMSLLDAGVVAQRFTVEAWDISQRALDRATQGFFGGNSFRGGDLGFRDRYFQKSGEVYRVLENVRSQVTFRQANLLAPEHRTSEARYDVIFCRNLLIYFDRPTQHKALEHIKHLLLPDGITFVGPAEAFLMRGGGFMPTDAPMAFGFKHAPSRATAPSTTAPGVTGLNGTPPSGASPGITPATLKPIARPPVKMPVPTVRPVRTSVAAVTTSTSPPKATGLEEAQRLADSGRMSEAEQACETFLRRHNDSAEGHYLLGVIRDALGNTQSAAQSYRKVLYLNPGHSDALRHLALLAQQRGDVAEARRLQERARRASETGGTN